MEIEVSGDAGSGVCGEHEPAERDKLELTLSNEGGSILKSKR